MDVSAPYRAIAPTLDLDVLVVLAGTSEPLTARSLRLRSRRGSDRGIRLALARLVEQGLAIAKPAGAATLYSMNDDHLAAPIARELAGLRTEFVRRLRAALADWPIPAVHASMFGSAARGDGDASSDIDLLIVRPHEVDEDDEPWRAQVDGLVAAIPRWTGNPVGLAEIGADEVPRLAQERPSIVDDLQQDAIDLAGSTARALFGRST